MRTMIFAAMFGIAVPFISGCGDATDAGSISGTTSNSIDGSRFLLSEEPDDAIGVIEARESAVHGGQITVVGRIGGTTTPWVNGRAAFMLLDASMVMVAEGTDSGEGEICTGDCCAAERAHATMLVKILDENGRVLAADSRQLLGLAENDMVVVRGKATKDKSGNVAVVGDAVFIRR
jgi:hypothetical protein